MECLGFALSLFITIQINKNYLACLARLVIKRPSRYILVNWIGCNLVDAVKLHFLNLFHKF